ncbi:MAG: TIGR02594 family protein [Devosia sp.]|uniref:TIGR02594 family protein n=1 Tax=Devosia sp. TaxID=1871048 RepID=UPI001AD3E1CF|nr:TIGR02594 family protein [Devosia sp.]MBN9314262.1 TIGR02594 family protein [Devosia sp.]
MSTIEATPIWLRNFEKFNGVKEIKGKIHAKEILELLDWADGNHQDSKTLQGIRDDETAYCSSALCGNFEMLGIQSTRNAMARSWQNWGDMLGGPAVGAIVVFWRGDRNGTQGHVGIVVGRNSAGQLIVFGANQDDQFKYSAFGVDRVLGYRWPAGQPKPTKVGFPKLPITSASPSRSEA